MKVHGVVSFQSCHVHPPRRSGQIRLFAPKCQPDDQGNRGSAEINEDVLAKLRAFEEENKKLKDQLASTVRKMTCGYCAVHGWPV